MTNEFLLQDRIQKIQQIVRRYGEDNFCISFSGGKDSCVLSVLVDMALPGNKIPRVYANTGIELNMIRDFALHLQAELDKLAEFFPAERKQCEYIWKPVYEEYRRLGYRLKENGPACRQMDLNELIQEGGTYD